MGIPAGSRGNLDLYLRALREAKSHWTALGATFMLGLLWAPISLLLPLPVKIILDNVTGSEPLPGWLVWLPGGAEDQKGAALIFAVAMSIAVTALVLIHNTADWLLRERVAEHIVRDTRQRMMAKALALTGLGSRAEKSEDLGYRVIHDAPAMQWVTIYGLMPIVLALSSLVVLLVVTSQLSLGVALIALATSAPLVLLIHFNQGRMRSGWHGVKEREAKTLSHLSESLKAWKVVINCGQERQTLDRFQGLARSTFRARLKVMSLQAAFGCLLTFGVAVGTAAILYTAVQDVQAGYLTSGDLILITAYVGQLYKPIQTIAGHMSSQQAALASAERNFNVMDEEPSIRDKPESRPVDLVRGEIEFCDVSFGYDLAKPIISECSFRVPVGSWVGISGPSGAGKSTLANLLLRFIDPVDGTILLDGMDLRDYRLQDLRRQFGLLAQDSLLMSASIEENIAFARPGAAKSDVVRAAKLAQAHEFILALPDGYATLVGEDGCKLSGGQSQRVALARAYLKDAPILVLDEPTSALDVATEKAVISELKFNLPGRTVFLITHRPSVLQSADLVLHVEKGKAKLLNPTELSCSATSDLLVA